MGASKNNPGNANLPIGGLKGAKNAIRENGVPRPVRVDDVPRPLRVDGVPGVPDPVWHSRGYLPHFECPGATQHVTFHLADSLPQTVLLQFEAEMKTLPAEKRDAERRKRIDAGHGSCVLRKPGVADMVQRSLLSFDSQRYRLLAWS